MATRCSGWVIALSVLSGCGGSVEVARSPNTPSDASPGVVCHERDILAHEERVRSEEERVASVSAWTVEACDESQRRLEALVAEACSLGAGRAHVRYVGAVVREHCGDHEGAVAEHLRVIASSPNHCGSLTAIGRDALARGDLERARTAFERAAHRAVDCAAGWEGLAALQRREAGGATAALASAHRAIALRPTRASGYVELALAHLALGQIDLAEDAIARGIAADPDHAPAHVARGLIAERRGDVHAAIAAYDRAIEIDPSAVDARMNRGALHFSVRAYDAAEPDYRRAVEVAPERYEAWLGLGIALRGLRRTEAARAAYERAIEIDRDRPEAYYDLGVLYDDFADGTEADRRRAQQYFIEFVRRAADRPDLEAEVQDVTAQCGCEDAAPIRRCRAARISSSGCVRGRIERIECSFCISQELPHMQAEAQRMAAEIEAQAEEQRRAQESESPDVRDEGGGR